MSSVRLLNAWSGATVFLSSALVMVLEIAAGLSLGNRLGGRMADRGADRGTLGNVPAPAALASLAALRLPTVVAPAFEANGLDLLSGRMGRWHRSRAPATPLRFLAHSRDHPVCRTC